MCPTKLDCIQSYSETSRDMTCDSAAFWVEGEWPQAVVQYDIDTVETTSKGIDTIVPEYIISYNF